MKMKKITILIAFLIFIAASLSAYAENMRPQNITLNYPTDNIYNSSNGDVSLKLNVTVRKSNEINITRVTWYFVLGSNSSARVFNDTINGSKSSLTSADFIANLSFGNLSAGSYLLIAEIRNDSDIAVGGMSVNSTAITFIIDRINPTVSISNPLKGSTVVPNSNIVTFEYTPVESNLGNCTLHLNNQEVKSSTSSTLTPNVTTGVLTRFTNKFGADNSSVQLALSCRDLAGLQSVSDSKNNFTFNVILGSVSAAVRQAQAGGGSGSLPAAQQQGFTIAAPDLSAGGSTHLQRYGWLYLIVAIVVAVFAIKKIKK